MSERLCNSLYQKKDLGFVGPLVYAVSALDSLNRPLGQFSQRVALSSCHIVLMQFFSNEAKGRLGAPWSGLAQLHHSSQQCT